eukprot:5037276-Alexandrium_andersonii.AAC.1
MQACNWLPSTGLRDRLIVLHSLTGTGGGGTAPLTEAWPTVGGSAGGPPRRAACRSKAGTKLPEEPEATEPPDFFPEPWSGSGGPLSAMAGLNTVSVKAGGSSASCRIWSSW